MNKNKITVLGIETSCDDTSMAVISGDKETFLSSSPYPSSLSSPSFPQIRAHLSFNHEKVLAHFGGIVPEVAARNHMYKLMPLLKEVLKEANINLRNSNEIDIIAVTTHPGLLGPLLTGLNLAKTLSLLLERPIFPVNHLYAHLEAIHLHDNVSYPYLGLLVSGGHSIYFLVRSSIDFCVIGSTIDDAAGEAFDKGGRLMGLPYPSGRIIDDLAKEGDPLRFEFPVGLKGKNSANLSYSGTKTSLKNFLQENPSMILKTSAAEGTVTFSQDMKDLCASYQRSIVMALKEKLYVALEMAQNMIAQKNELGEMELPIVIGGGVAANGYLRKVFSESFDKDSNVEGTNKGTRVHFVLPKYCTDNGAMIANYALRNYQLNIPYPKSLEIDARGRFIEKTSFIS
ncbi:MAG: tRNA (adenosine(37)-N6)-threonylcarbamoyltransferase complex transferase subunit TsaD [Oligoflexia bacterium]|nr:tRNA (adenosine(37)-N6)-threonylcarbamoyltransferase complex transferase subunit TsaD [Oligoflexia bacterium]